MIMMLLKMEELIIILNRHLIDIILIGSSCRLVYRNDEILPMK
jgi:hypothetical protein